VILEIVRPGTGDPVAEGEVGEVVVTPLNPDYPLVRFGTGDLSAVLPGRCPTGRSNTRIKGWMGRADQTAKVRGMFVHPSQVAEVLRRHPQVHKARLVIEGEMANDRMSLHAECAQAPEGLAAALAATLREVTKLRGEVVLAAPGSLANDGKVIEDAGPDAGDEERHAPVRRLQGGAAAQCDERGDRQSLHHCGHEGPPPLVDPEAELNGEEFPRERVRARFLQSACPGMRGME
jgi:acyl-CoA synthetase (AMP-forming)/AMP-acid ligase II